MKHNSKIEKVWHNEVIISMVLIGTMARGGGPYLLAVKVSC